MAPVAGSHATPRACVIARVFERQPYDRTLAEVVEMTRVSDRDRQLRELLRGNSALQVRAAVMAAVSTSE